MDLGPAAWARAIAADAAAVPAVATCLQKGRQVFRLACLSFRPPLLQGPASILCLPRAGRKLATSLPASGNCTLPSFAVALPQQGFLLRLSPDSKLPSRQIQADDFHAAFHSIAIFFAGAAFSIANSSIPSLRTALTASVFTSTGRSITRRILSLLRSE